MNAQHHDQSVSHKVEGGWSSGYEAGGEAAKTSTSSAKMKALSESHADAELNNADYLEALYSQQLYCLASAPFGIKTLPRRCQGRRGRFHTSSTADSEAPPAGGLRRVEACPYLGSLGIPSSQEPSEQGQGAAGDGDSDSEPGFLLGLRSGFSRATSCGSRSDFGAAEPPTSGSCHATACSGV
ncbi:unnamed protein product [Amoebophrya sp. A120]|nr:unnamed protein product [Amoebophrya sp. A120]|eukprot:GSA120T00017266001.1